MRKKDALIGARILALQTSKPVEVRSMAAKHGIKGSPRKWFYRAAGSELRPDEIGSKVERVVFHPMVEAARP